MSGWRLEKDNGQNIENVLRRMRNNHDINNNAL